jgi:hypothetical protein
MSTDQYVYAEPEEVQGTIFMDEDGKPHLTREDAINQNVARDIERHLRGTLARAWPDDHEQRDWMARIITNQIRRNDSNHFRQMVRELIEGTD